MDAASSCASRLPFPLSRISTLDPRPTMRPWPYPRILAHRGGGTLAPENTIEAIDVGRAHGYRGVEFDVMLAADAVPVLIHDPTLERTTSGRGDVAAHTARA